MDIRERYNVEESKGSLVIYPHKPAVRLAWQVIVCILPAAVVLFFLRHLVGKVVWASLYVIMVYGILYSLYEIYIRASISYRFCKTTNAVYKSSCFVKEKKILTLDELVIFTSSETGTWHYAMGAQKSQFIKNYAISEHFSGGKKSEKRLDEYENEILEKINRMVMRS